MAFDSTADLLFRISADTAAAQADLAALRASMSSSFGAMVADSKAANAAILYDWAGNPIKRIGEDLAAVANTTAIGGRRMVSSTTETREAFRGLGEEIGVRMPRFVSGWLSSLGGVSTVMAAAFAPIAVIGLIEVLSKIPTALEKGIDWLHGWTAESKKAFEESTRHALAWQTSVLSIDERLRAIPLIGLEGTARYHAEMQVNKQDLDDVAKKLDQLQAKQTALQKIAGVHPPGWKAPEPSAAEQLAGLSLTGETGIRKPPPPPGPSHEEIEKAKLQLKELAPVIKDLTDKLTDLTVHGRELAAEATAAAAKEAKKPLEDFTELSRVLDQVQSKLAGTGTAEDKVRAEMTKLADEAGQARVKLEALNAAHKVSPETYASQMAAWEYLARMIPELQDRMFKEIDAKRSAEIDRQNEDLATKWLKGLVDASKREGEGLDALRTRLGRYHAETLEDQERAADAEIDELRQKYVVEAKTGEAGEALVAAIRRAEHTKIETEAKVAGDVEIARLGEQLERIVHANQTTYQRIADQYQADVAKFSAAEERKSTLMATSESERAAIAARFAAIRAALYTKEQNDLQAFHNSTGWQGVFGSVFASTIKGNEALSQEWKDSTAQSQMLVRVAMESTKEMSQELFDGMAKGMGGAIAQSLVYSTSFGEAMKKAAASTLESISAQALVQAIYSTAWGFYDLAVGDYPGAASAFEAAALFGSVGAAAGVAGRAITGGQSSTAAGSTLPSETAARQANMQSGAVGAPVSQPGVHNTIIVQGNLVGWTHISELTSAINDAVLNSDVTLTSTNTKNGVQVTR